MKKNFKKYSVDFVMIMVLGKNFTPNFKRFNQPMPKTTNYLVFQFASKMKINDS